MASKKKTAKVKETVVETPVTEKIELNRMSRVMLQVYLMLEELIQAGLATGPKVLTEEGEAIAIKDRAEGFEPTEEELISVVQYLKQQGKIGAPLSMEETLALREKPTDAKQIN